MLAGAAKARVAFEDSDEAYMSSSEEDNVIYAVTSKKSATAKWGTKGTMPPVPKKTGTQAKGAPAYKGTTTFAPISETAEADSILCYESPTSEEDDDNTFTNLSEETTAATKKLLAAHKKIFSDTNSSTDPEVAAIFLPASMRTEDHKTGLTNTSKH